MVERYLTIGREHVHESEIKRSRFLCALAPVSSEEAAQEFLARVRKEHAGATHNCYAYVLGAEGRIHRASDDGEPGGTAGTPMLQVLLRREVRDVVAVVTRYYGGVQLGAGGLVRAYGGAVSAALDEVGTVERRKLALVTVVAGHQRAGRIENDLRAAGRAVRGVAYGAAEVRIELGVPQEELAAFRAWLADASAGTAGVEVSGSAFVDV
ncbi:YigZ family protein [Actinacidiphila glaucinigra]|uniref:YigZ family protein n=1 Tax=Actinacidiphila glaucinigra TaxID=235986 RepID=UPI0038695EFC